jgi:hypothetical protein
MVLFYGSISRLGASARVRRWILASFALALLASTVRTVDPVSRALYGTFAFGSHDMLRMTRVTGECCGFGQDQLAYNLQFTAIQPLVDDAVADMAGPEPIIVVPDSTVWLFTAWPAGWPRRGARPDAPLAVRPLDHRRLVRGTDVPDTAWYLAMPNGDNARAIRELSALYDFGEARRYERSGYALSAYRIVRRRAGPP